MEKRIKIVALAIIIITSILSIDVYAEDIAISVNVLVEPVLKYDSFTGGFSDGLLLVTKDRKDGFIDKTGKLIIPCEYQAIPFSEGVAVVYETNENGSEKWGFIDTSGNVVIPLKYNWVSSFNNDRARFKENGKYGLIDKEGNIIVPASYAAMWYKYNGTWDVYKDGKWGIIDKNGDFVLPLEFDGTYSFSEGMAVTQKNNKYGFINEKGEWIIPAIYNNAASFHEGLAWVLENDKGSLTDKFIDKTGKVVLDLDDYDYKSAANYFSDGLCLVHKNKKFGFIDKTGNIVIPMVYDILDDNPYSFDAPDSFHDGRAIVKKDGKYGIIDTKGKEVVPVIYDYIRYFINNFNNYSIYNGYVAAEKDGKWGILNYRTGIEIVPRAYDFIGYEAFGEDGLVVVEEDGKYGILQIVETKPNKFGYVLTATPAKSTVFIDGKETVFDAYEIDGETYFKLRDLAYTLSGTANQFEVIWDSAKNAINLTSGKAYTPVGGEMSGKGTEKKTPVLSKAKIYLNGKEVTFTAYTIEGNNYFTLTSMANAVGFVAERNGNPVGAGNTFIINTAPFNETLEKYYDYVRNNNQIILLTHEEYQTGFTDVQMAAYAFLTITNRDSVNGNTKEEFDIITEKYFGKKIDDYNTRMTYIIPETGRIAPTGWDVSQIYMVLKELSVDTNGIKTGIFYTIYIHPGDEYPEKNDLLSGKFETFLYREYSKIYLVEMKFKEKYDENGEMYFEYLSINYTGNTVCGDETIVPYGK